jgi:hypothetical protein
MNENDCTHGGDCIVSQRMRRIITTVDAWLDREVAHRYRQQPLAQDWARVAKVAEEAGEAVRALIDCTGQNPRRGVCGSPAEVLKELADVVCTGLFAIQHFTGDADETAKIVEACLLKARGAVK